LQAEAISQSYQVVEDADDVRDLQTSLVVESEIAQWLPVAFDHAGRVRAQFLGNRAQGHGTFTQAVYGSPVTGLQGRNQRAVATFDTQKLCVRLSSVETILGRCRHGRDHFPFAP